MQRKRRNKARDELMMVLAILVGVIAAWYLFLYQPVTAKTALIREDMKADKDSIAAIDRYKQMEADLQKQIELLNAQIEDWDARFPPRSSLVTVAKRIIAFCHDNGIQLVEMHPSLFELYALEQAGNTIAGRFVFKQLFNLKLRGNYINVGRMLEKVENLPFRITVSDVKMMVVPDGRPNLDIELDMFIYVHR